MIKMSTKVTIGLCVKNGEKIVKIAFNSVSIQDYPHELMKLVIVDNGSSDNTLSLAMKFAQETDIKTFVTSSKGKGLGETRQIAVENAEGDYIVWVDDDLALSNDFVRNQVEFMEKNPNVGAAKSVNVQGPPAATIFDIILYEGLLTSPKPKVIGTGGAIFRLKALKSVGGFDIQIKGAGEDIDVSRRIREAGWTLSINSSAKLYKKHPPQTFKAIWKRNLWYGYAKHFLVHKYNEPQSVIGYFPPFALLTGLKISCSIYRLTSKKRVFFFSFLFCFRVMADCVGFIRAHLDGYGHANCS
jgi:glycosyltransferase involved in cell wall biosynthesis